MLCYGPVQEPDVAVSCYAIDLVSDPAADSKPDNEPEVIPTCYFAGE